MPIDTKSLFADQDALVATLYRLEGLADAIFAVAETGATEVIAEGAMFGIQSALKRDLTDLREAASGWDIVVAAPAPAAEAPAPDPVLSAIDEWRVLEAAHLAAIKENDRLQTEEAEEAEEAQQRACLAVSKFEREVLLKTKPTTTAGAVALLRAVAEWLDEIKDGSASSAIRAAAAVLEA